MKLTEFIQGKKPELKKQVERSVSHKTELKKRDRKEPIYHPKNKLNDLNSREWTIASKSWFVQDGREKEWKEGLKKQHPATYPKAVAEHFIHMYTQKGMTVLDPMAGSGSTLLAAQALGRESIGIDLYPEFMDLYRKILKNCYLEVSLAEKWPTPEYLTGPAASVLNNEIKEDSVDFCIFSPPYGDVLNKSSGGARTRQKDRKRDGLPIHYGKHELDLGNMGTGLYISNMIDLTNNISRVVKKDRYMVIVIQNDMKKHMPIAFHLTNELDGRAWMYWGEKIWCQDEKMPKIHGWPKEIYIANHHHYCLIFKNMKGEYSLTE